ncbi:helix-turn-helix domain-containing protein [Chryseobacterium defluvii]|uniref:Helix-turn-helix protein n=1 Tax=Chryseobacterium defluvii TaxID=160396 RepID=A0A495SN82_9FLAO|nr:helix-turn-helix domain-containing protein [Chryseobacterium defluvii]RKT01741.1 helix-turn-helix protein [Chryseobacterium defluvii]
MIKVGDISAETIENTKSYQALLGFIISIHIIYFITSIFFNYIEVALIELTIFFLIPGIFFISKKINSGFPDKFRIAYLLSFISVFILQFILYPYNPYYFLHSILFLLVISHLICWRKTIIIAILSCAFTIFSVLIYDLYSISLLKDVISKECNQYFFSETIIHFFIGVMINLYFLKASTSFQQNEIKQNTSTPIFYKNEYNCSSKDIFLFNKIADYFEQNKPWQNPDFNQTILAEDLGTSTSYISKVLNNIGSKNFNDSINSFRIDQVIQQIEKGDHEKYTLRAIYTEAGFKSQATFNRAFKKEKGLSPSEYIEKYYYNQNSP